MQQLAKEERALTALLNELTQQQIALNDEAAALEEEKKALDETGAERVLLCELDSRGTVFLQLRGEGQSARRVLWKEAAKCAGA